MTQAHDLANGLPCSSQLSYWAMWQLSSKTTYDYKRSEQERSLGRGVAQWLASRENFFWRVWRNFCEILHQQKFPTIQYQAGMFDREGVVGIKHKVQAQL